MIVPIDDRLIEMQTKFPIDYSIIYSLYEEYLSF